MYGGEGSSGSEDEPPPGEEEVAEYGRLLGIDVEAEPELLWIAREGILAPLPPHWAPVEAADGQVYFHNSESGQSLWEHPLDAKYRTMVAEERKKVALQSALASAGQRRGSITPLTLPHSSQHSTPRRGSAHALPPPPAFVNKPQLAKLAPITPVSAHLPTPDFLQPLQSLARGPHQPPSTDRPSTATGRRPAAPPQPDDLGRPKTSRGSGQRAKELHEPPPLARLKTPAPPLGSIPTQSKSVTKPRSPPPQPDAIITSGEAEIFRLDSPPSVFEAARPSQRPASRQASTPPEDSTSMPSSKELTEGGEGLSDSASQLRSLRPPWDVVARDRPKLSAVESADVHAVRDRHAQALPSTREEDQRLSEEAERRQAMERLEEELRVERANRLNRVQEEVERYRTEAQAEIADKVQRDVREQTREAMEARRAHSRESSAQTDATAEAEAEESPLAASLAASAAERMAEVEEDLAELKRQEELLEETKERLGSLEAQLSDEAQRLCDEEEALAQRRQLLQQGEKDLQGGEAQLQTKRQGLEDLRKQLEEDEAALQLRKADIDKLTADLTEEEAKKNAEEAEAAEERLEGNALLERSRRVRRELMLSSAPVALLGPWRAQAALPPESFARPRRRSVSSVEPAEDPELEQLSAWLRHFKRSLPQTAPPLAHQSTQRHHAT